MKQLSTPQGKHPIRYGWQALSDFADNANMTMDDIINSFDPTELKPSQLSEFIFQGMKDGCREANTEFKLKDVSEIAYIINGMGLHNVVKETLDAFQASPFLMTDEEKEEPVKKK